MKIDLGISPLGYLILDLLNHLHTREVINMIFLLKNISAKKNISITQKTIYHERYIMGKIFITISV